MFALRQTARMGLSRASTVLRPTVNRQAKVPVRNMGGGSAAPPPTEGIEALVHQYFPEGHHKVMGVMGFYFSLYLISKLFTGGKKKEEEKVATTGGSTSDDSIVSMADDKFSEWMTVPGNAEKWEASLNDPKSY